ncbi:unnamed protein product [Choristocarpus tenellus]
MNSGCCNQLLVLLMVHQGALPDVFYRRYQLLSLCYWITLLVAVLFAMSAMDASGQCYTNPCNDTVVTGGLSLVTGSAAFLFIMQASNRLEKVEVPRIRFPMEYIEPRLVVITYNFFSSLTPTRTLDLLHSQPCYGLYMLRVRCTDHLVSGYI